MLLSPRVFLVLKVGGDEHVTEHGEQHPLSTPARAFLFCTIIYVRPCCRGSEAALIKASQICFLRLLNYLEEPEA